MPADLKAYRIFIASPSGLEEQRELFAKTIHEYNSMEAHYRGVQFLPMGWKDSLGGMGRPQEFINKDIRLCDYFILLLRDRWGSEPFPSGESVYTSATEEEYYFAQKLIQDPDIPLKQIMIFFQSVPEEKLAVPDQQLQNVIDFRRMLDETKENFYHTFDTSDEFNGYIRRYLGQWLRDHEFGNRAKHLAPTFTKEEVQVTNVDEIKIDNSIDAKKLVKMAVRLESEGKFTDAEVLFARAVSRRSEISSFDSYGDFLTERGRFSNAIEMYKRVIELAELASIEEWLANGHRKLGFILSKKGDIEEARKSLKIALEIEKGEGAVARIAQIYTTLGMMAFNYGSMDEAEEYFTKSLKINEDTQDHNLLPYDYNNIAIVHFTRGDYEPGMEMMEKSIKAAENCENKGILINGLANLAYTYLTLAEFEEAESLSAKAISIGIEWDREDQLGYCYAVNGLSLAGLEKYDRAEKALNESISISEKSQVIIQLAGGLVAQGDNLVSAGRFDEGEKFIMRALDLAERHNMHTILISCHRILCKIELSNGNPDKGFEHLSKAEEIARTQGLESETATVDQAFGEYYAACGDYTNAERRFSDAIKYYEKIGAVKKVESLKNKLPPKPS